MKYIVSTLDEEGNQITREYATSFEAGKAVDQAAEQGLIAGLEVKE